MPQVEAGACGVPIATVNYSAMCDIVNKLNAYPIKIKSEFKELETKAIRVYPDNDDLAKYILDFIKQPDSILNKKRFEIHELTHKHYDWTNIAKKWENYLDKLDNTYKALLESNIAKIGLLPEKDSVKPYTKNNLTRLKYSFNNLEDIDKNFSQAYQDIFVLSALNGKMNGSYLEIGSSDPYKNNNTALLENKFAWSGIGLECDEHMAQLYKKHRRNPVLCVDALIVDYAKLLQKYFPQQNTIDYLQLDIDPPKNTYEVLLSMPFNKYQFAVITYEHDYYIDISKSYRNKSREYLNSLGYKLIAS
jgi:hypothetical protein